MANVKMVALKRVWKYAEGQEFEVTDAEARALVLMGNARRVDADGEKRPEQPRRGPGRPRTAAAEQTGSAE